MVQAGQCADSSPSAVLVHNGEKILLAQDFDPSASGCRLDLARLQNAGECVAEALAAGADLLIVNRFGKRERDGKGLGYLVERSLAADIPVVIAVSNHRFADWLRFAGGMTGTADAETSAVRTRQCRASQVTRSAHLFVTRRAVQSNAVVGRCHSTTASTRPSAAAGRGRRRVRHS